MREIGRSDKCHLVRCKLMEIWAVIAFSTNIDNNVEISRRHHFSEIQGKGERRCLHCSKSCADGI